ncbi:MAG: hypothetical protein GY787_04180, partial [Alteromonadales bacterium]|nr:hypothetical protein [Alteromonadales bacterium]
DSGFIFDIPTQTSCAISDEITISAVRKNPTSEQCLPSFSNVQKTLKFWSSYDSPATGTKQVTLKQNSTDYPLPNTEGSEVPIAFDTNGQATFKVTYPDAGRLALNASYDGSGSEQGLRMIGNDLFVSAPAKLVVSSNDNDADCSSADANCNAFKVAGATFNLSISATCDDPNNTVTPNFQMNDIALSVKTIAPVLLLPNPVALAVNSIDITEADKGVHTENAQTISEVGVFTITATPPDNGYLGETIAAATSTNIGRFIPSYFEVGGIDNGVLSGGHPFVYSGQMVSPTSSIGQISYDINPEFTLTAKSLTDSTTLNYTDDFIKLLISGVDRKIPTHDAIQRGADGVNEVDLSATLGLPVLGEFSPGVLKYQFNGTDNFVYTRNANALIPPFTATIDLQINSIKDSDNVIAKDIDTDTTNGILTLQPQGPEIRFGRWILENSYGPETTALRMPMFTQYWSGSYFVTNNLDGFTSFNAT